MRNKGIMKNYMDTGKWVSPAIANPQDIPKGDMPGDKINIREAHIKKAQIVFPSLLALLRPMVAENRRVVVSVHGGSGVGKSEIGSLLAYYLNDLGIGTYIMSGDNYPHRYPEANDSERLRIFRESGIKGLVAAGEYSRDCHSQLSQLREQNQDVDHGLYREYPWLEPYQTSGAIGLRKYLGTQQEIDFDEVNRIIYGFKSGAAALWLKRMGRDELELWYDHVEVSGIQVLLIEWTHGNNDNLLGVDIPILLSSTPSETLEHRRLRNRDKVPDSPFISLVLELEQKLLISQAQRAKLIVTKHGDVVSYNRFLEIMSADGKDRNRDSNQNSNNRENS